MSALYTQAAFLTLVQTQFNAVLTWVSDNPGKSIEECATALSVPYEAVYQICMDANLVILPSASGEIHWHAHKS